VASGINYRFDWWRRRRVQSSIIIHLNIGSSNTPLYGTAQLVDNTPPATSSDLGPAQQSVFKMPSAHSQKGTGKKGRDIRQSRSRNTTPSLAGSAVPPSESGDTAYLALSKESFRTSDDIVEPYGSPIPTSKDLETLLDRLKRLVNVIETRGAVCDRGMRMLAQARKDRLEEIENQRRDEEQNERLKKEAADEEERGRTKASKIKKKKDSGNVKEERPLTHGAHGVAPQDGSQLGMFLRRH
jgi:transcriptional adapter 3